MKKTTLLTFCLVITAFVAFSEVFPEKGVPPMENFSPRDYHNTGKIWSIGSAPNRIVYLASDRGLLEYDGNTWNHSRGSNGFTRSVKVINDTLIATGSDLDFGIWTRNQYKEFEYTSLYPFQEDLQEINEEFWGVHYFQQDIIFVSSQSIYVYKKPQLVKIAAPSFFTGSFLVNEVLYFADRESGIFTFEGFSLKKVLDYPDGFNEEITGMYQGNDGLVVVTRDAGLYRETNGRLTKLNNQLTRILETAKVFSFEKIGNNHLAFGTVLKGLYITDMDGRVIHHINRRKGLPSNTILSMHFSPLGHLWLGMDYGVTFLDLNSKITTFYDFMGDFGTGYTAILKNGVFYLGTNQGLYRSRWEELSNNREFFSFRLIQGTEGQVWSLANFDNILLMGHDRGLFIINEDRLELIGNQEGVWTIVPYRDYVLTGNYNGIFIFRRSGRSLEFYKKMDLIFGSCNQLIIEGENILWVNIPNFGVIRATLGDDLQPVERLIFTMDTFEGKDLYLVKDEQGIHALTEQFQYTFDNTTLGFRQTGPFRFIPLVEDQLSGINMPVKINADYKFVPLYNGFALKFLGKEPISSSTETPIVLRKITGFNNHERARFSKGARIPFGLNNIAVELIVPNTKDVMYQYKVGVSGSWSDWQTENSIELLSLPYGEFDLFVRGMTGDEIIEEKKVSFRIMAPWYYSWWAYTIYILFLVLLFFMIMKWQAILLRKQKKELLKKEKKSLQQQNEKHKQELLLLEQKRLKQEFEQLKQQLKAKTIELAKKARDNEEKNRLLLKLKEKCEKAQKNPALIEMKWGEMQRMLDSYLNMEDKTFEIQMDELHQEFFKKLKERFPDLSNNDLRLCAYLKIGLNSKEIAELINIQPSSFYISRSRLRKKLNLKPEEDLYNYLNEI